MCRWTAYRGKAVLLEKVIVEPAHSLVRQSLACDEGKTATNGDGFGVGWYGERAEPGLYREIMPAWSDDNLRHIARQVRSSLFFAHVRAATGTATSRTNCHPFAVGRWMFMHNGQIGNYLALRRRIEALIPDALYDSRMGTTDSEAIFLAALGAGLEADPVGAIGATLARIDAMMAESGAQQALRFTAALSSGEDLYAFRTASDGKPPTLYYKECGDGLMVVSEPIDDDRAIWKAVPPGYALVAKGDAPIVLQPLDASLKRAA